MRNATILTLGEILRAALDLPADADVTATGQGTTEGWDSLAHAVMIGALESEFGIVIDPGASLELTSYRAIVDYLEAQGL